MVKVHINLDDADLAELERVAKRDSVPKSLVIREALGLYLARDRRRVLESSMRRYAERHAAESGEFVRETSPHVTERLLRETEW